jgi:Mlc titration factor MtfA (ptsG expression regulator)
MTFIIIFLVMAGGLAVAVLRHRKQKREFDPALFPVGWRAILEQKVAFYAQLDVPSRRRFEQDVFRFLDRVRIEGVKTTVDITDKLLVASSAVIPVFGFPEWDYTFLDEVLIYPGHFDTNFGIGDQPEELITGMVGSGGVMERKMILSKPALHQGFANEGDKKNVGIHEFIHLLDKEDGAIDGIPTILNQNKFALPWLELIRKKTEEIIKGRNEIDAYGATNQTEFLAVAGEYFFERPQMLQKNHPELYDLLTKAFNQDTTKVIGGRTRAQPKLGRNSPCPCGSGRKYKDCCLKTAS